MLAGRAAARLGALRGSLAGLSSSVLPNPRLLITTLLSTTTVVSVQTNRAVHTNRTASITHSACCNLPSFTTLVSFWTHKSCLAADLLELEHLSQHHHTRKFSSSANGEECLQWYDVDTQELVDLLKTKETLQLFDVREPEELVESGIIPGAVNVPLGEVEEALVLSPDIFKEKYKVEMPSKTDTNIIFHCRAGVRSLTALEAAHRLGYSKARHYVRGFLGWEDYLSSQGEQTKSG